jgi:hypothetical protein
MKGRDHNNLTPTGSTNQIAICFQDDTINYLFAGLLESRGVHTTIVETVENLSPSTRLITEPLYLGHLSSDSLQHCLVVGNKESLKGLSTVTLSRPLTEEKIENAISEFLNRD